MRKSLLALTTIVALTAPQWAAAQDSGNWLVRARAVHMDSANTNSADLAATLTAVAGTPASASINNKWLPEVDISYFFTPNWAAELILTYPQKQTLSVTSLGPIGTFKHLPPTLTAQYHFTNLPGWRPYVGLGLNYTNISSVHWYDNATALDLNLKRNSVGLAAQLGFDVPLGDNWLLNLDLKKVQIKTDVTSAGTKIGSFKVDPVLLSMGLGKRF
jgi:outer membrane protein